MASESTGEATVTVSLPPELDDWLDERATEMEADRGTVLVQLLTSYRAASEDAGFGENGQRVRLAEPETVEETVTSVLAQQLDGQIESEARAAVEDALAETTDRIERVDSRVDDAEAEYTEKLEDVRNRVVQLKREIDGKAAADHDHAAFDRIAELSEHLAGVREAVDDLEATVAEIEDRAERTGELAERLETVESRLQTVAWVVSDLRDAWEAETDVEAVDRIKRAAAEADVERANCDNCGHAVSIGLLTQPECPHCRATVTDVQPASWFLGSPRLVTASELESGEER
jgi:uncharacterized protein YukE